jgi:hypothetical protein
MAKHIHAALTRHNHHIGLDIFDVRSKRGITLFVQISLPNGLCRLAAAFLDNR